MPETKRLVPPRQVGIVGVFGDVPNGSISLRRLAQNVVLPAAREVEHAERRPNPARAVRTLPVAQKGAVLPSLLLRRRHRVGRGMGGRSVSTTAAILTHLRTVPKLELLLLLIEKKGMERSN